MRFYHLIIALAILLIGCNSSQKSFDRGNYDSVVSITSERLLRNKKVKDIELQQFVNAYQMAWERDKTKIEQLKRSGGPERWAEIFDIYSRIQKRQDNAIKVNPLMFNNGESVILPVQNIQAVREEARQNAAEYYYQQGLELLKSQNRNDARIAFERFNMVLQYYKDYKDVQSLIRQAEERGTAHILLLVDQNPQLFLPQDFAQTLLSVDYNNAVGKWIFFYTDPLARNTYDYAVKLIITESFISPGVIKEHFCDEQKEIENGWQYVYDSRGNVMKDSLGNDLKVPKYIQVKARLTETQMFRQSAIRGKVDFIDYRRSTLLKSVPAQGESNFNHYNATFQGDKRALSTESLSKLKNNPLPFPTDADMIMLATNELKRMFGAILKDHQKIFNTNI